MPVWSLRGNPRRRQGRNKSAEPVDGVHKSQPSMRIIHARDKCVGRGILVRDSETREEKGHGKERKGRLPEVEAVGEELGGHADDKGAGHAKVGGDVHDREGANDPAGEIDEVDDGHEEGAYVVGGLDVGDEGARRGVCEVQPVNDLHRQKIEKSGERLGYIPFIPAISITKDAAISLVFTAAALGGVNVCVPSGGTSLEPRSRLLGVSSDSRWIEGSDSTRWSVDRCWSTDIIPIRTMREMGSNAGEWQSRKETSGILARGGLRPHDIYHPAHLTQ